MHCTDNACAALETKRFVKIDDVPDDDDDVMFLCNWIPKEAYIRVYKNTTLLFLLQKAFYA